MAAEITKNADLKQVQLISFGIFIPQFNRRAYFKLGIFGLVSPPAFARLPLVPPHKDHVVVADFSQEPDGAPNDH